jgi:hypothetical protein
VCHLSLLAKIAAYATDSLSVAFVVPTDGRQSTYSVVTATRPKELAHLGSLARSLTGRLARYRMLGRQLAATRPAITEATLSASRPSDRSEVACRRPSGACMDIAGHAVWIRMAWQHEGGAQVVYYSEATSSQ